jgi:glycosyltransferase involved in cell wall biosynthesis
MTMAAPLVSIVVNNFNYGRFLGQSIESALAQDHARTEVIVVDDASTDGSRDVIAAFGNRVLAVCQERNGGQAAALNAGFAASRGDLVIFLDADDYLYPRAARVAAAALERGVGTVQYRLDLVDRGGRKIDLYPAREIGFDSGNVVPKLLETGRYEGTVTSGNAFARATLASVLPIPEDEFRICADGYLITAAPFYGAIAAIEEPLGAYRLHGDNLWSGGASLAGRFRRAMRHDADKHRVLAERAAALGLRSQGEPGLADYQHVGIRLGSLCLEPEQHPVATDTRLGLALRGARAALHARLPWRRRLVLAAWFLSVGVPPRRIARHALAWNLDPRSRPPAVDGVLKVLRRMTA